MEDVATVPPVDCLRDAKLEPSLLTCRVVRHTMQALPFGQSYKAKGAVRNFVGASLSGRPNFAELITYDGRPRRGRRYELGHHQAKLHGDKLKNAHYLRAADIAPR